MTIALIDLEKGSVRADGTGGIAFIENAAGAITHLCPASLYSPETIR